MDLQRRALSDATICVPSITLHLRGGRDIRGLLFAGTGEVDGRRTLLLHVDSPDGRAARADVCYVDSQGIEGITVHAAQAAAHWLSRGTLTAPVSSAPPPGQLDIRRKVEDTAKSLSASIGTTIACEVLWDGIISGEQLRSLEVLMSSTRQALGDIAAEALGRDSLRRVLRRLAFGEGPKSVMLEQGVLRVNALLHQGLAGQLTAAELRSGIGALL